MKKIKAFASMLTAVAVLTLLPGGSALKADAAEAKNYAVKYCPDSNGGEWRYQEGSSFDDSQTHREMYYLLQDLKDGDKVAVYNTESNADNLNFGNVKLGDLTLCGTAMTIVYTGGISQCNILAGSTCSINGDVDTAHVYDVSTVTFVNNVNELIATADNESFDSNIGCGGTVAHFNAYSINAPRTFYDFYNFDKGTLAVSDGSLKTDYWHYSDTASAATPQPQAAAAPSTPAVSAATTTQTGSGEYDDVPKTGENNPVFWLLAVSVLCFTGSHALRRSAR